jgi:DNA-binding transcriptional LysR family regulator
MEWQQMIGFYRAAKLESFTKAANATLRTQSALSQQIKALEQELDCTLFERIGKRKLVLTTAGERFLRFTEALFEQQELLVDELNEIKGRQIGRLRIAAQFAALYYLLPKIVGRYMRLFPQVELLMLDRSLHDVIQLVRAGDIDLGIGLESAVPKDLETIRWKDAEVVLVTPVGHPLAKSKRITFQQIAQYPLILAPKSFKYFTSNSLEKIFEDRGLDYKIVMEASTIELGSKYVELGLGISIVPAGFGLDTVKKRKVRLIPIQYLFRPDYISVIKRKDRRLQPYKSAFVDLLVKSNEKPARSFYKR